MTVGNPRPCCASTEGTEHAEGCTRHDHRPRHLHTETLVLEQRRLAGRSPMLVVVSSPSSPGLILLASDDDGRTVGLHLPDGQVNDLARWLTSRWLDLWDRLACACETAPASAETAALMERTPGERREWFRQLLQEAARL